MRLWPKLEPIPGYLDLSTEPGRTELFQRIVASNMEFALTPIGYKKDLHARLSRWCTHPWRVPYQSIFNYMHQEDVRHTQLLYYPKICVGSYYESRLEVWLKFEGLVSLRELSPEGARGTIVIGDVVRNPRTKLTEVPPRWCDDTPARFIPVVACLVHFQRCPECWHRVKAAMVLNEIEYKDTGGWKTKMVHKKTPGQTHPVNCRCIIHIKATP